MKNIFKMLAIPVFVLAFTGCSQDVLEDINENKNNPADVASRLILTDAIASSAFNMTSSDMAFYASVYIEHNVGTSGQMNAAEIRAGEPINATTYNNQWGAGYTNLYNLRTIINKTSEGGAEAGNFHVLGMAQILFAYNLAILTDAFGDIPYTEALLPGDIFQPKIDSQESIYVEIFSLLDKAIDNLKLTPTFASVGSQDLLYKGDAVKWTKFAQGLKARYTTRLALVKPGQWAKVIEFANLSFTTAAEQAQFVYNGTGTISPFQKFFTDRNYFGASKSLHDKLVERADPRDSKFFKAYPKTPAVALEFAPSGLTSAVQNKYGISALSSTTSPTYLMSYHELEFLKAEAYARMDQKPAAKTALKNAVLAAFKKVGVADTTANKYFDATIVPRFDANALKEIMNQKYFAFFEQEAFEAYNDIRRLKAGTDEEKTFITFTHPSPNLFPLRFTYGADDVTTNPNVFKAYGDGQYVYTEPVWWAKGER